MKKLDVLFIALAFLIFSCTESIDSRRSDMIYTESFRPQFHFTPEKGWMNDPNGMFYLDGEYHLFYQYYPYGTVWGPMHWGHAVSKDLVYWEHLPIALYPDELGHIFSGSAVVDWNNTSGLGSESSPPIVAIFTQHDQNAEFEGARDYQKQSIAYSLDKGRSWTKYKGNPVLPNQGVNDFRDPKVIWHNETQQWIMALAVKDWIEFYGSPNLIDWKYLSEFGRNEGHHDGVWECPDLFPMKIEGTDETKWVLIVSIDDGQYNGGSGTQYFIGDFDGNKFVNDNLPEQYLWLDLGRDNYAGVSWSDIPKSDGRRLFIGWMSNWKYAKHVPTHPWRSAMTLPRELKLISSQEGIRLVSIPVDELQSLRSDVQSISKQEIHSALRLPLANNRLEMIFEFEMPQTGIIDFQFSNEAGDILKTGYQVDANYFYIDRTDAGIENFNDAFALLHHGPAWYKPKEKIKIHLFLDQSSLELFADDGRIVMTDIIFPKADYNVLEIMTYDWPVTLIKADIFH